MKTASAVRTSQKEAEMFDKRAVFTRVKAHLLQQGRRALVDPDPGAIAAGACAYRGHDGTKCAIGCLIKDEFYTPLMEGPSIYQVSVQLALAQSLGCGHEELSEHLVFLRRLQKIHDEEEPDVWATKLNQLARDEGLGG